MKTILKISIFIFLLNLFLKTIAITSIPPTLTNDETYYASEAQAILANGSDVTGTWHPWNFAPANFSYAELTSLTYTMGFLMFPHNTLLAMRVIPILFGSLLPILLGFIAYRLFERRSFFSLTALLATFNPWIFQFSRMSFDSFPSVFFYILGMVGILYLDGWWLLLTLLPFGLGFFQYQGHKPLLIPFVLLSLTYSVFANRKDKKEGKGALFPRLLSGVIIVVFSFFLVGNYLHRLPQLKSGARISEISISQDDLSAQVNVDRRLSFRSPLTPLFENKFVILLQVFAGRFFASFDPVWLFQHGNDTVDTFAVTQFGFLYPLDALLILIGITAVWSNPKWRYQTYFLCAFVIIGAIPNVLKNDGLWLTFRGSFLILGMELWAAIGFATLLKQGKRRWIALGLGIYAVCVMSFLYQYFYRYPLLATRSPFFYDRVVAEYIRRQPNRQFVIYGSGEIFRNILVYNQLITPTTINTIHTDYQQNRLQLGNFTVTGMCFDQDQSATQSGKTLLTERDVTFCPKPPGSVLSKAALAMPYIAISSVFDSWRMFTIYNDTLCDRSTLPNYINVTTNILDIGTLSNVQFCQAFFRK